MSLSIESWKLNITQAIEDAILYVKKEMPMYSKKNTRDILCIGFAQASSQKIQDGSITLEEFRKCKEFHHKKLEELLDKYYP